MNKGYILIFTKINISVKALQFVGEDVLLHKQHRKHLKS